MYLLVFLFPKIDDDFRSVSIPITTTSSHPGITLRDMDNLPPALGLLLLTLFSRCKSAPPPDWPPRAYALVLREDLAHQAEVAHTMRTASDYMECE